MKLSDIFNAKVLKGAAAGTGIAFLAAALLPVITVCAPVLLIGTAIGSAVAYNNKDDKGPKN
jgi:hypothetical protein